MAKDSKIEWTHHTFNPWWGCVKVSPGCHHCYADTLAKRTGHKVWGPAKTTPRRLFGGKYWAEPLKWNIEAEKAGERHRVFCGSMCDVFEDHPTANAERVRLWPLIRATPWLDWLLLTKRPENIEANLPEDWGNGYENVWLGTSVENSDYVDRARVLAQIPAVLRFLSVEPLLGPVALRSDWYDVLVGWDVEPEHTRGCSPEEGCASGCPEAVQVQTYGIQWVIVGGESGGGARPMDIEWARSLRDQCAQTGVAFFLKQLGGVRDKRGGEDALLDGARHIETPTVAVPQ